MGNARENMTATPKWSAVALERLRLVTQGNGIPEQLYNLPSQRPWASRLSVGPVLLSKSMKIRRSEVELLPLNVLENVTR